MAQDTLTQPNTILTEETVTSEAACPDEKRHPLAHILGAYKDDPMLDAVMEEVYKNRQRLEAEANEAEQEDLAA
jgi:hypothetical protein